MEHLKQLIRSVPRFSKKGILFYDITTLLKEKAAFKEVLETLAERYRHQQIDLVLALSPVVSSLPLRWRTNWARDLFPSVNQENCPLKR